MERVTVRPSEGGDPSGDAPQNQAVGREREQGKYDLLQPSSADLDGVRRFLETPTLSEEKVLCVHAANQLSVENLEDPRLVPHKE